ncbi:MAG TPA: zinc ribbon domain-containing protein [Thermoplasmata archaeon]|nr:zinc ribbon domain-containing protein [Thermoplasmata archaeon]
MAAASPLANCAACGAALPAGVKFCPQCGAAVGAAPAPPSAPPAAQPPDAASAPSGPPAPGGSPTDIRSRITESRGTLQRLQLLLPGFHGYRQGEDARMADELLRKQVADKVHGSLAAVQAIRQSLTQQSQFGSLNDLAYILTDLQTLEGEIRHAEQGYSGIAAAIKVGASMLDRLYEYDYGFVLAADQLRNAVPPLEAASGSGDAARIRAEVDRLRGLVQQLKSAVESRMTTGEGLRV